VDLVCFSDATIPFNGVKSVMADENVTRQLAAIFYADVSGYSRLTHEDEIGTHRQLSADLDLMADRIRNAGGTVVHYAGDAVLARFQKRRCRGLIVPSVSRVRSGHCAPRLRRKSAFYSESASTWAK